jgi:signal transduction histidine kinase
MKSLSLKLIKFPPIYLILAAGFIVLLSLILLIGKTSFSKLDEISIRSKETTGDYVNRLTLALGIRESAAEVVAEARVYRARQGMKIPIPPFSAKLKAARRRFEEEIEKGKNLWSKRKEHDTLPAEELAAWREVESTSRKFLDSLSDIDSIPTQEDLAAPPSSPQGAEQPRKPDQGPVQKTAQPEPTQSPQQEPAGQTGLLTLRNNLDAAAKHLTDAVTISQRDILNGIGVQQAQAAQSIRRSTTGAFVMGIVVVLFTFFLARRQILDLRRANQMELEAKDFARSIFDSQSNDIIVVNNDGELIQANKAFLNHFKLPAPLPLQQDYRAALSHLPEVAAFVGKTLAQPDDNSSLRERIEVRPQYGLVSQNGSLQSSSAPSAPVPGGAETRLFDVYTSSLTIGGQSGGRVVVIVDVTEAEKVREELRRSRTLSAVGQITATVAHELYNPIGAVKLNLDLLEMQVGGDGDIKHTVARLKRGVEHLSTIVMDLRYLTRPRNPEPRTADLNKLLDEVVELASDRLERSRICVNRNYAAQLPRGQYDTQQLRKVFLNLLINAVEASPQNGNVELRTQYVSGEGELSAAETNGFHGELVISVIDQGVGMSEETKRRLFEAFYTTKRNGTGLGMMITQEIVKKHGGKMEVDSEEGKGTTVSVYLPV